VVSHKSLQLIITAHEDNTILFWDSRAGGMLFIRPVVEAHFLNAAVIGEPVHKMVAHQAPVSSLAIDPTGAYLVSTGTSSFGSHYDHRGLHCLTPQLC